MNIQVLGFFIGVTLAVFCMFCLEAWAKNNKINKITDAEIEAWQDWLRELERWARRRAFEEEFRAMGAREMPLAKKPPSKKGWKQ